MILWILYYTVWFLVQLLPVPNMGTVCYSMGMVWENLTHRIPILNSNPSSSQALIPSALDSIVILDSSYPLKGYLIFLSPLSHYKCSLVICQPSFTLSSNIKSLVVTFGWILGLSSWTSTSLSWTITRGRNDFSFWEYNLIFTWEDWLSSLYIVH